MNYQGRVLVNVVLCSLALCGCNGTVWMREWEPDKLEAALKTSGGIQGVFAYYTKSVIEVDQFTQLLNKEGKVIPGACEPVYIQKIVTVTDYEHPYQVYYEHGFLDTSTFGVTLSNSVLVAVNSQSTPDQGKTLANLAEAAAKFAVIAGAAAQPPPEGKAKENCGATPTFVRFEKLPALP